MSEKHLSQLDLQKLYNKEVKLRGKKEILKTLVEQKPESEYEIKNSVFLSHSHLDKTIVEKAAILFKNIRLGVYIDWLDSSLPSQTNHQTATTIKYKIDNCKKFIFLATYNALKSKWCNWELGLAYASRGEKDFAVLPVESRAGRWPGNEYLNLYPEIRIQGIDDLDINTIQVNMPSGTEVSLNDWLIL